MKPIRQYVDEFVKNHQITDVDSFIDWHQLIGQGGYHWVEYSSSDILENSDKMFRWLHDEIGRDHYLFVGTGFWFDNQQNQMLFILTWK